MSLHPAHPAGRRARLGVSAAAAVLLLSVAGAGWGIAKGQANQRTALMTRFDTRQATAARFIEAYVGEVFTREQAIAGRVFTGPTTGAQFAKAAADQGFDAAILVDADGRLLATQPENPTAVGKSALTFAHVKSAVGGVPAVSGVVLSAARGLSIVGFAVPFDTPTGRRVFSGGYAVNSTPLALFVHNALPFRTGQVLIVDAAGVVVASNSNDEGRALSEASPQLSAIGDRTGSFRVADKSRYVAQGRVEGTPWRLLFVVDDAELLAPLQGAGRLAPWLALAGFGLAALTALALLYRYLRQRSWVAATEERRRAILDSASDGFVGMDDDGTIIEWNAAAARLLGWSSAEAIGQSLVDVVVPEEHRAAHRRAVARFLDSGQTSLPAGAVQVQALRRDGSRVDVDFTLSRMPWKSGWHFYAFLRDVTQAKAAAGEREANAAMLRGIIENSQSLIYVKDLDGKYLLANTAFLGAFAVTESDLIGRDDKWLDAELEPVWRKNDVRARDGAYRVEEWSDGVDGRHWYESVKFPLNDANGELHATCGVSLDVTVLKRAALAMEQARDAALEASVQKSTFLANMSHEIRTPMNGVLGMADLLMDSNLNGAQRRQLQMLRDSASNLLVVINDILDFSKVEAGKLTIEQVDFDLLHTLDSVAALFASTAGDKGLSFDLDVAANVPQFVTGDPGRLRQILNNLLGNAVKFTLEGGVRLVVGVGDTGDLRFEVIDSGIGLDLESLPDLMSPFMQADASTTRRFGGTGLGLTISKQLAELMGGQLAVASEPGLGSTFWVTLPMPVAHTRPAPSSRPVASVGAATPSRSGRAIPLAGIRVLVVDDGEVNREVARGLLARLECHVTVVESGYAALDALREARFDVVLMDCLMPGLDGYATTGRIRALEAGGRRTTIIALTASALAGDRERCLAADMDDYLAKPLDPAALAEALRSWQPSVAAPEPTEARSPSGLDERLSALRNVVGAEAFDRIGTAFLDSIPLRLDRLLSAVATDEVDEVRSLAHSIGGSCASLGADQMAQLAQCLELSTTPVAQLPGLALELERAQQSVLRSIEVSMGART